MTKKYKKVFKLFWAWEEDKECDWLREMSNKGWHLKAFNMIHYFEKGEPKDYVYNIDWKSTANVDIDEYITIFGDLGWEHVTEFFGYQYFRTESGKEIAPSIYSDNTSKIEKFKGLRRVIIIGGILNVYNLFNLNFILDIRKFSFHTILNILVISVTLLIVFGFYKINNKIKELEY